MEFHQKGGNGGWIFKTNEPHFFKIVLEGTLRDGLLGIPKKFVTKYENNLSSPSLLTVPSGEIWKVELAKSECEMWYFQAGWKEFAEFYSLAVGDFLVFQYKGGCNFHVLIFDRSATEIDYPLKGSDRNERFQKTRMEENEILNEFPPSKNTIKKCIATTSRRGNQSGAVKLDNTPKDVNVDILTQSEANAGERGMSTRKNRPKKFTARTHALRGDAKNKAYSRARATFRSRGPFFMIAMQPSYVSKAERRARIPSEFARKYFKQRGNAVLCGLDGRRWYVRHSHHKFSKGWKKFIDDSHLEVGDVCIFELIKGTECSFNVVICRVVRDRS